MHTLYLIAIVAEAMSGALMGMRRGMDRFGLALVGAVTALGGGTVRDVLLGHYPLGWIAHPQYLVITLVAATVASRIARHVARMKTLFVTVDALGLAAFTIIGCDVGASTGAAPIIVVLAGAITGVCGGMLRDLLCNEMPLILRRELYASVAFFTGALYVALQHVGIDSRVATIVALAAGFAMRMLAVRFGWETRTFGAADIEH
ncbi:TPA: trimeric intracellular cation channel family protein [Burkholderia multivorans]|uniref:trimeric intracellular cation channel family protein n=1 Tax=Burkholderia multivorans TaxID=87883 RepID=UPI000CFEF4D6|nr:trimeric intracellular cation channel family protein [Burkholderia multivorans]MBU9296049.1 trimeric intracellular cation channel family protein [Burkholderia multivorans]MBU9301811.1 trimeric intracellular cation channel family protein [Burkholderia multivorans]MBU9404687.1 trimeric intracellular cation channel family protein [Burkholderia multivorans]MBU9499725.1 trimeric intracellular cation channel family protein [Burkholderia multivorans]MBU9505519.1 trimeric intracellular cation chann